MNSTDSILRTYVIESVQTYPDLTSLRSLLVSLSEDKIALATSNNLIITQGYSGKRQLPETESFARIVVEFDEEYGRATALKWLSSEVICVGFENGCIACFLYDGTFMYEHRAQTSQVQSLRVSNKELYPGMGIGLWVLFEDNMLITIPLKNIFNGAEEGIARFRLSSSAELNDFVFLPNSLLKGSKYSDISHSVLVSGVNCALALHSIGGKAQFQHLSRLAALGKDKAGTAISKTLSSFFGGSASPSNAYDKSRAQDLVEEYQLTPVFEFEDTKRRILRLSIDPRGKLIACADGLGRVMLVDTRINTVIRIWKGVRDARLAWSEGSCPPSNSSSHKSFGGVTLCLAIYAPQIGLLSLYAMKHGGCLRTIPVGPQAQIITLFDKSPSGERFAKCGLLRLHKSDDPPCEGAVPGSDSLSLTVIAPYSVSDIDIDPIIGDAASASMEDAALAGIGDEARPHGSHFSTTSTNSVNSLRLIESKLYVLIQDELDRKPASVMPNSLRRVDEESEAFIVGHVCSISTGEEMLLCIDLIDTTEQFGVLQMLPTSQSSNILKTFCQKLEKLKQQYTRFIETKPALVQLDLSLDGVTLGTSPNESRIASVGNSQNSRSQVSKRIIPLQFSERFHRELIMKLLSFGAAFQHAALRRLQALRNYSLLMQQCIEPTTVGQSNSVIGVYSNDIIKTDNELLEEVYSECRKPSARAEALCWVLRVRRGLPGSEATPASSSSNTPENSKSTGSFSASVPSPLVVGSSTRKVFKSATGSQVSPPPARLPPPSTSPMPSQGRKSLGSTGSDTLATHDIWEAAIEDIPISFSLFLSFLDKNSFIRTRMVLNILDVSTIPSVDVGRVQYPSYERLQSTYRVAAMAQFGDETLTVVGDDDYRLQIWTKLYNAAAPVGQSLVTIDAIDGLLTSMDVRLPITSANESNPTLVSVSNTHIAGCMLNFVFAPLLVDIFSIQMFTGVLYSLGLHGGASLCNSLPMIAVFFEKLSMLKLTSFMTKQLATSPFQRWLRDSLLGFESDLVSAKDLLLGNFEAAIASPSTPLAGSPSEDEIEEHLKALEDNANTNLVKVWLLDCIRGFGLAEGAAGVAAVSYDIAVGFALRPALRYIEQSVNLEAAMVFTTLILETIIIVGDQIERRSYGAEHLKATITEWSLLRRKIRTTIFLSCRCGLKPMKSAGRGMSTPLVTQPLSVQALDSGIVSIYALLASDTLCFASKADHAVEHENRCLQVYSRRVTSPSSPVESVGNRSSTVSRGSVDESSGSSASRAILAWGATADKRWRELIQVTESEDQIAEDEASPKPNNSSSSVGGQEAKKKIDAEPKKIRRRRPLLLFFPQHNHPHRLGIYRVLTLFQKWLRRPSKLDILTLSIEHLVNITVNERAALAFFLLRKSVLPVMRIFFLLENNPSERPVLSSSQKDCITALATPQNLQTFIKIAIELIGLTKAIGADESVCDAWDASSGLSDFGEDIWPPLFDPFIDYVYKLFDSKRTDANLNNYLGVMWVLFLRSMCGLRGIKPYQLFELKELNIDLLQQLSADINIMMKDKSVSLLDIRYEFILQCFRRVDLDCSSIVYRLAGPEAWNMDPNHIRLANITALLDQGGIDDQAEAVIAQVTDIDAVVDCVVECLRLRLGATIARIEKIPPLAKIFAVMDSSAVSWVRSSVGIPDPLLVDAIAKGKLSPLGFNLSSTRHLVIRMHGLLLGDSKQSRESTWIARREKCDALLSLCTNLAQLQQPIK